MKLWLDYSDGEVSSFHPICKRCLDNALSMLGLEEKYTVAHHTRVGTIQPDFEIVNAANGKTLCVVEVKRTPAAVSSMRFQIQAQSYVVNKSASLTEKPFYILTNLEDTAVFRHDPSRPMVYEQLLEPGMLHCCRLNECGQEEFERKLSDLFVGIINKIMFDDYSYKNGFTRFIEFFNDNKADPKMQNSALAAEFYEYIRGALSKGSRFPGMRSISSCHRSTKAVCMQGRKINFKEIFSQSENSYSALIPTDTSLLEEMFNLGKQHVNADAISDILYRTMTEGREKDGEVGTDPDLAQVLMALCHYYCPEIGYAESICDPGAGGGNLLAAAPLFYPELQPHHLKANDADTRLAHLLSLRLGLMFPATIANDNSPEIITKNIAELDGSYFENVRLIVMNPPYVSAVDAKERKAELSDRIFQLKGSCTTNRGQMGLEGPFIELITQFAEEGTVIGCIIPKTHLTARGEASKAFREFLCNDFGLKLVYTYPGEGLFESVTKDTCIVVGVKGQQGGDVLFISGNNPVADNNLAKLAEALKESIPFNTVCEADGGFELLKKSGSDVLFLASEGWRVNDYSAADASAFIRDNIVSRPGFCKLKDMHLNIYRGKCGDSGASDLMYISSNKAFFNSVSSRIDDCLKAGLRRVKNCSFDLGMGDQLFFDIRCMADDEVLYSILDEYCSIGSKKGKQKRKVKSIEQLRKILENESRNGVPSNSLLIPRALRINAPVFRCSKETFPSTNVIVLEMPSEEDSYILGSWMSSVFYQINCEMESKNQDGMRKMEIADLNETYIPDISLLSPEQRKRILDTAVEPFLNLTNPQSRKCDLVWAGILSDKNPEEFLNEARTILGVIASARNS